MKDFTDLPDLASEALGGWTMWANDEFFAAKENLLKPHPAEWREHEYTDKGKWMDGWETRRRREPGSDVCIIRLGLPGVIKGVVVDTAFFRGNYPAECMIEAARIETNYDLVAIHDQKTEWKVIVPRSPLKGDSKNLFESVEGSYFTHVRLTIYPDGGVARLRIHGQSRGDWRAIGGDHDPWAHDIDLAALENGAQSIACSDMFFGSRHHLILPGKPLTMGGGWETRRRRGPGHDWNMIRFPGGGSGVVWRVEVDTLHFKGNAPGRCSIDACWFPGDLEGVAASREDLDWRVLLPETPLQPNTRHVFEQELRVLGEITHVRLNVFPDGGVARLRCIGERFIGTGRMGQTMHFNGLSDEVVRGLFRSCCASTRWVEHMMARRPFWTPTQLFREASRWWWPPYLQEADWLEAFAAHPRIGGRPAAAADKAHAAWSTQEQTGAAAARAATLNELAELNREYEKKHGFTYIVCATGKTAEEMLAILKARLSNPRDRELRTAAEEQAKITQLRLRKMLAELPDEEEEP